MPDGEALRHDLPRPERRRDELQRIEDELLHGILEALPGDGLDNAARDREAGVVVRPQLADGRLLRQLAHARHVHGGCVVAPARVVEVVAEPATGMREQVPQRHALRCVGVGEHQVRQVLTHGPVEVEVTARDKLADRGSRERLRDRPDLEAGVRRHVERVLDARHAVRLVALRAVLQHADGDARNTVLLARSLYCVYE